MFKDVIGQTPVKQHLVELVHSNRLSHALLFLGPEGSGALPMALAFSQYVVCENRREADACGVCPSCVKAQQLMHPDIHYSYPVIPKKAGDKPVSTDYGAEWREFIGQYPYGNAYDWLQFIGAENKQGNITAQECNDIIRKLNLKSFESGYKILVMWMPEYLGNEGNKLLKLIEEPPADTLFLLVAENESLILPTILSRTQLVKIPLPETVDIERALAERAGLGAEQARQIAVLCEGNYHEALQLIRHAEDDWQGVLREWLNAILKNGPIAQVKWIEEISKSGRERQKQFLRYFNHLLEQAIRLRYIDGGGLPIPEGERDIALRLNKIADIGQQRAIIEELDNAAYYIERNAHAKMLFHALTIKVYHILADRKIAVIS
ncbi:DNA polymerase III subunit [Puia dinghuensis]|uniref:DNA polymerase III subunit delta n=1 Tax=Puia dinghuensis TaxID=1792502 RepID=A0A8J2UG95_9BACT|nr:DNA polymerase III subunit delta' [Puia dinghuensis]GGB13318.1 DNA polymerase III subunit delta [Puia dinghuensis]